jgi:riboflavin biosynthesis pyrimidine reductase
LPDRLRETCGGDLQFPAAAARPVYIFANFVATLDGVVSHQITGRSGGGEISGFSEEDRFIMGLSRSASDAVLIGAGTLRADPGGVLLPGSISPAFRQEFPFFRETVLKKPAHPLNVVISGSGNIDLDEPIFHTPGLTAVIITTALGYDRLRREHGRSLAVPEVRSTDDQGPKLSPASAIRILHDEFGVERLLLEGGPTLFGQFLAEGLVDELFLTLSPQIAGQDERHRRLGVVEQLLYSPEGSPWFKPVSLKAAQDHLFLRYRNHRRPGAGSHGSQPSALSAPQAAS